VKPSDFGRSASTAVAAGGGNTDNEHKRQQGSGPSAHHPSLRDEKKLLGNYLARRVTFGQARLQSAMRCPEAVEGEDEPVPHTGPDQVAGPSVAARGSGVRGQEKHC
jgi:hypothetical protein